MKKNIISSLLALGAISALGAAVGCVPEDVAKPVTTTGPVVAAAVTYASFSGISKTETIGAARVKISWEPSSDSKVVAYNIYDVTSMFFPAFIKTVSAPLTSITINSLNPGVFYKFRVRAADIKNVEDANTNDLPAIPYGGATTAQVLDSSSATVSFSDGTNSDAITVHCMVAPSTAYTLSFATIPSATQLTITGLTAGSTYTCRAALTINGFEDDNTTTTAPFTPIGVADHYVFSTQPGNSSPGTSVDATALSPQPVLTIQDLSGNTVTAGPDATATITLTNTADATTLGACAACKGIVTWGRAASTGCAACPALSFTTVGTKQIIATKSDTSGSTLGTGTLTPVTSGSFMIVPGAPLAANCTIAASTTSGSTPIADGSAQYTVTITLKDKNGNLIPNQTPTFSSTSSTINTASDILVQPSSSTTGIYTGTLATTVAGTRTITINSPTGLSSVINTATFIPGSAYKLAFTQQPTDSPAGASPGISDIKVAVEDHQSNIITTDTSSVTITINSGVSGAVLSGTSVVGVTAGTGVATFSGLNIDKSSPTISYTLKASVAGSGVVMATSSTFKITAGGPAKIAFTGGTPALFSGVCSGAYTVQLQDPGNNPSNPTATTVISLAGGGSGGIFYSNSTCGTAITTLSFSTSTNTKTIYFKDNKAESLTLTATGSALATGSTSLNVNPSKVALAGSGASPISVLAGQCSGAFTVSTAAYDNSAGNVSSDTVFSVSGMSTTGNFYTTSTCTGTALTSASGTVNVTATAGTGSTTVYFKDPKAESVSLNVTGPTGFTTTSTTLSLNVLASHLAFTGPPTVLAGACSTAFTVQLQDANSMAVSAPASVNFHINGLSSTSAFYSSSGNCASSSGALGSTLTITSGSSSATIYFKDTTSEPLTLYISDTTTGLLKLPDSAHITLNVSPSALGYLTGAPTSAATSGCAGPFTVNTLNHVGGTAVNAVTSITVGLTGQGAGGVFYRDACVTPQSSFTITGGTNSMQFWFNSLAPSSSWLTFTAAATGLTSATTSFIVTAAPAWIGTTGIMSWFETGKKPVTSRVDSVQGAMALRFSPSDTAKRFLYVLDTGAHRVLKYDYTNTDPTKRLVGWIGQTSVSGGITGTGLTTDNATGLTTTNISTIGGNCTSTGVSGGATPNWCTGGVSIAAWPGAGGMYSPSGIADDGTHLFVSNSSTHAVTKYNLITGAFEGWIGDISAVPTSAGTALTNACTSASIGAATPGWCKGGSSVAATNTPVTFGSVPNIQTYPGDGTLRYPSAVAYASPYIYVASGGQIKRYNASSGAYMGWIGRVYTSPTGHASDITTTDCEGTAAGAQTPNWCTGGSAMVTADQSTGAVYMPATMMASGETLYAVDYYCIKKYTMSTGAFLGLTCGLHTPGYSGYGAQLQMSSDGATIYAADWDRIVKFDTAALGVQGWIGTVSTSPVVSTVCSKNGDGTTALPSNASTPGWCQGGTPKNGMDEKSVHQVTALELDASGNMLTGQSMYFPGIKRWNLTTGAYGGTMSTVENGQNSWNTDASAISSMRGFGDVGMSSPSGLYNDGTYLYVADKTAARIKKISLTTGEVLGWLGGIASAPTGGDSGCLTATVMGPSPAWCLGAYYPPSYLVAAMIPATADGIISAPGAMTGDGTYLYVLDGNRIAKFNLNGTYMGWIGGLASSPSSGTCTGVTGGASTSGWCKGGSVAAGSGDGYLNAPTAIFYSGGELYVADYTNNRVTKHNATTGAFDGWIGRIGTGTPSGSGCTIATKPGYTYASGWCKGGTSQASIQGGDPGGGFYGPISVTGDGTYLYIGNHYNSRVDKFTMAGVYVSSVRAFRATPSTDYSDAWLTDPTAIAWNSSYGGNSAASWSDGTYIYETPNSSLLPIIVKRSVTTGTIVGWMGGIGTTTPTGPSGSGCVGSASVPTPNWCVGGSYTGGYTFGKFYVPTAITGDANYIYVADSTNNRVTRLPK